MMEVLGGSTSQGEREVGNEDEALEQETGASGGEGNAEEEFVRKALKGIDEGMLRPGANGSVESVVPRVTSEGDAVSEEVPKRRANSKREDESKAEVERSTSDVCEQAGSSQLLPSAATVCSRCGEAQRTPCTFPMYRDYEEARPKREKERKKEVEDFSQSLFDDDCDVFDELWPSTSDEEEGRAEGKRRARRARGTTSAADARSSAEAASDRVGRSDAAKADDPGPSSSATADRGPAESSTEDEDSDDDALAAAGPPEARPGPSGLTAKPPRADPLWRTLGKVSIASDTDSAVSTDDREPAAAQKKTKKKRFFNFRKKF